MAQCGAKNDRGIRPDQCTEAPDQRIHRAVSEQDGTAIALDLVFVRLQRKRVGIHMTPIGMLQMGGAVDEKCRKIRLHSAIVMSEQIELQAIRESYATPFDVRLRKPLAAELRQYRPNCLRSETVTQQECQERQPLIYSQRHAPGTLLH